MPAIFGPRAAASLFITHVVGQIVNRILSVTTKICNNNRGAHAGMCIRGNEEEGEEKGARKREMETERYIYECITENEEGSERKEATMDGK